MTYTRFWNTRTIYAPVIVVNGTEWNGWARGQDMPISSPEIGVLSVDGTLGGEFRIAFEPLDETITDWTVHGALLACEVESKVKRGENQDETFLHEFVAMAYQSQPMRRSYDQKWKSVLKLKFPAGMGPKRRAVAIWISRGANPRPLQAVGRYYPGGEKEEA